MAKEVCWVPFPKSVRCRSKFHSDRPANRGTDVLGVPHRGTKNLVDGSKGFTNVLTNKRLGKEQWKKIILLD